MSIGIAISNARHCLNTAALSSSTPSQSHPHSPPCCSAPRPPTPDRTISSQAGPSGYSRRAAHSRPTAAAHLLRLLQSVTTGQFRLHRHFRPFGGTAGPVIFFCLLFPPFFAFSSPFFPFISRVPAVACAPAHLRPPFLFFFLPSACGPAIFPAGRCVRVRARARMRNRGVESGLSLGGR